MKSFKEPGNLAVLSCSHVVQDNRPILLVTHDVDDGTWQFLCGAKHHLSSDAMVIALDEILALDPSVAELADLPLGYSASRPHVNGKWVRHGEDGE